MNQIRKNTLIDFYNRMTKIIETDLDLILFIQCFDALQKSEGHGFNFYQEDFHHAMVRRQSLKSSQHQPEGQEMENIGVKAQ